MGQILLVPTVSDLKDKRLSCIKLTRLFGTLQLLFQLTGASIQVASEALPTSTERTVTISGSAKAIAKCIRQLCDIFIEVSILLD